MVKFKKYTFFILELFFILLWGLFIIYFFKFYNDAFDFVETETSPVIQLLLIIKYRGAELVNVLILEFLLITANLLGIASYYFSCKLIGRYQKNEKIKIGISVLILLLCVFFVSLNPLLMVNIPLMVLGFSIVYIAYLVTKYRFGKKIILNEEVLGEHGPFKTKKELENYITELKMFNDITSLNKKIHEENEEFFITFYKEIGEENNEE